jgi:hypothetical protein
VTRSRTFALAVATLALAACGGKVVVDGSAAGSGGGGGGPVEVTTSSTTGGPSIAEATCLNFCEIAGKAGCPPGGDCQARCLATFVDACGQELKSALDCAGPSLQPGCILGYPESPTGSDCANKVTAAVQCLGDTAGFTCSTSEQTGGGDGSCVGKATCSVGSLSMTCDSQGTCICASDGQTVGTCKNLIGGTEFCSVTASCCTPLFKQ